jgi:histidinol-phosphate aminotransferase
MKRISPQPGVLRTAPYVPGERDIQGVRQPIKLSANESALGPSPRALAAYHALDPELFRYPDAAQRALREAISEIYQVEENRIVCGNGSDEVLSLLIRGYSAPGDEIVLSQYSFAMCWTHARVHGAEVVVAPEPRCRISVEGILGVVTPRARMVVIASPNNPCGTYISRDDLRRLHSGLPSECLLVIDAAYGEFVAAADYDSGLELAREARNVFVTHTFSKLYGLAGLRVGWGYGAPDIIATLDRIRTPFNVNSAALAAATAAVRDQQHAGKVRDHTARWRNRLTEELQALGLNVVPSSTNFVLICFPGGPFTAEGASEHLRVNGIIVRPLGTGGPENSLRITIGLDSENEALLAAMRSYMEKR